MATFMIFYGASCVILEFDSPSPCSALLYGIDQDVLFSFFLKKILEMEVIGNDGEKNSDSFMSMLTTSSSVIWHLYKYSTKAFN